MTKLCDTFLEALESDDLSPETTEHLATCSDCAELYRAFNALSDATNEISRDIPPPELLAKTLSLCAEPTRGDLLPKSEPRQGSRLRNIVAIVTPLLLLLILAPQFRSAHESELLNSGVAILLSKPIALAQGALLLLSAITLALPLRRKFLISALLFGVALFPNLLVLMRF